MKLLIKPENDEIRKFYEGHKAAHEGDSGVDIFCHTEEDIYFQEFGYKIKLGIRCAMVDDNGNLVSYILMPRSSISKTPLRMSNSIGLIDKGYRGEIMAAVDCNSEQLEISIANGEDCDIMNSTYKIEKGQRLFQIVAPGFVPFTIELVDELPSSERGEGGFGSTGK